MTENTILQIMAIDTKNFSQKSLCLKIPSEKFPYKTRILGFDGPSETTGLSLKFRKLS